MDTKTKLENITNQMQDLLLDTSYLYSFDLKDDMSKEGEKAFYKLHESYTILEKIWWGMN